jgi:hypothetical protein
MVSTMSFLWKTRIVISDNLRSIQICDQSKDVLVCLSIDVYIILSAEET